MKFEVLILIFTCLFISQVFASDSISYSGRLVNTNGSPVSGPVNLRIEFAYSGTPTSVICTQDLNNVDLSNGVFHIKLGPNCTTPSSTTLTSIFSGTPVSESVGIRVTDVTHSKTYSYQALHSMPFSLISHMAKQIEQMGASDKQVLAWNNTTKKWEPSNAGAGNGSVSEIITGTGLTGGPITNTGTISIATGGVTTTLLDNNAVTSAKILNGTILNEDVSSIAGIDRSKLANGTANYVLINDGSGVMSGVAQLPLTHGGTGASTASGARTSLGLGSAATRDVFGSGDVITADSLPSVACLPTEKLLWTIPAGWSCATDSDSADATKLPLAGGTMTGNIVMNTGTKITIPNAPSAATDAVNRDYVDDAIVSALASFSGSQWTTSGSNIYYNATNGNVGIGTTGPSQKLHVNQTTDLSSSAFNIYSNLNVSQTAHQYGNIATAVYGSTTKNSSFAVDRIFGALFSSSVSGGTANEIFGVQALADGIAPRVIGGSFKTSPQGTITEANGVESFAKAELGVSTTITDLVGYKARVENGLGSVSITNAKGLDVTINHTAGTMTNAYGVYVGAVGGTTTANRWSIYAADAGAPSYLAGDLSVATKLRLKSNNANYVEFKSADAVAATRTFVWPAVYGTSGQFLTTDGAGNLSWTTATTAAATLGGDLSGTTAAAVIENGAVTSAKILDGTIVNADIANTTITYGKLNLADGDIPAAKVNGLTTSLAGKEPTITAGTSTQYWRGDKTWQTLNTTAVAEGTNLYFTEPRVLGTDLAGLNITALLGSVLSTDDILTAIGKLQGQVTANKTAVDNAGQWSKSGSIVYYNGGSVGIGTATPGTSLEVLAASAGTGVLSRSTASLGISSGGGFLASTPNVPSAADQRLGLMAFGAFSTGTTPAYGAAVSGWSKKAWTSTDAASYLVFETANGYTDRFERMRIEADGKVGIGSSTPFGTLVVNQALGGNIYVAQSGTEAGGLTSINLMTKGNGTDGFGNAATKGWHLSARSDQFSDSQTQNDLNLAYFNGTTVSQNILNIDSLTGNIGIGTTSTVQTVGAGRKTVTVKGSTDAGVLELSQGTADANGSMIGQIQFSDSNSTSTEKRVAGVVAYTSGTTANNRGGSLHFFTKPNNGAASSYLSKMMISESGDVGIGRDDPGTRLDVISDAVSVARLTSSSTNSTNLVFTNTTAGGRTWSIGTSGSGANAAPVGAFNFYDNTAGAARFTILADGKVGVGTSSPQTKLDVFAATGKALRFDTGTNGDPTLRIVTPDINTYARFSASGPMAFYSGGTDASGNVPTLMVGSNGRVGVGIDLPSEKLHVVGNILASGSITPSDKRLKKNFVEIEDPLQKVTSLSAVTYEWRDAEKHGSGRHMGVIAQEVQKAFPEAVTKTNDGFLAVSYQVLVSPLIGAVKELYTKITKVSEQTDSNKREIASLKEENIQIKAESQKLKNENAAIKAYLCSKDPNAPICK